MSQEQSKVTITISGSTIDPPSYTHITPNEKDVALTFDGNDVLTETRSITSTTSTLAPPTYEKTPNTITTLRISAQGVPVLRLPLPSNDVDMPVHDSTGTQLYASVRPKWRYNSCTLSCAKLGDLLYTEYSRSLIKDPIIRYLSGANEGREIRVKDFCTTRTTPFTNVDGRVYEWKYTYPKDANGKRVSVIVLQEVVDGKGKNKKTGKGSEAKVIARLLRDEENRTAGTKSCTAGKGGRLDIDESANLGGLDESVIVATCILMLKKEVDRRRAVQMAMIAAIL